MYNFSRLINKYSTDLFYEKTEGGYYDNAGRWVEGSKETIAFTAACLPLTNKDLQYDEGGTYNTRDRKLYTYEELENGTVIEWQGESFTVQESRDYQDFDDGLMLYWVRRS